MQIESFINGIQQLGISFYTGVPDSQLKALCDYLMSKYELGRQHIVAANEGAALGLATGHFLSTGKPALVYMQNSGLGNAINPICSLINKDVYGIPALFVIGWRGEPGVKDEPQHIFQGKITLSLLECVDIEYHVLSAETSLEEFNAALFKAKNAFENGGSFAFVVCKGALTNLNKPKYENAFSLSREEAVKIIIKNSSEGDIFVSTTGKLSRELFEIRESFHQTHNKEFLTVGSMGHSSMIALEIALEKPNRRVFCLDGDGALLMHMGSLAVIGANRPTNFIHVLINNGAHETVGGIPTVSPKINYLDIATACGYQSVCVIKNAQDLNTILDDLRKLMGPVFIEIKTNLNVRPDLGRPTSSPADNKRVFMKYLKEDICER